MVSYMHACEHIMQVKARRQLGKKSVAQNVQSRKKRRPALISDSDSDSEGTDTSGDDEDSDEGTYGITYFTVMCTTIPYHILYSRREATVHYQDHYS